jgi:hypothetical protein
MTNAEWRMPNGECRMANAEWRMPKANAKGECQTRNAESLNIRYRPFLAFAIRHSALT